jgi:division protein CdvB (Snf7/Vps24/ESCRT-III family)
MMPDVSFELNQINESLEGIVVNTREMSEISVHTGTSSSEAERIMQEADALVEQKIKSRFPEITSPGPPAIRTEA